MGKYLTGLLAVLLAACASATPVPAAETITAPPPTASATTAASPTPASTPTKTVPPTLTVASGLVAVEHPGFFNIVFQYDPALWTNEYSEGPESKYKFLGSKTLANCRLDAVPPMGMPQPDQIRLEILGGRLFRVYDYGQISVYENQSVYFHLTGADDLQCKSALESLLAQMLDAPQFYGYGAPTPFATSTPRPPLSDFECDALAPRLRPGDGAYIIADGLWLRSEPRLDESTEV